VTVDLDLSARVGPVRDQGKRPTCIAFAASDLHAAVRTPAYDALSVEYLFYHARRRAAQFDPTRGATLQQTLESLAIDGQPLEHAWPYLLQLPADLGQYVAPSGISPIFKRPSELLTTTYDALDAELRAGRPAMIVFEATESFMFAQRDAPISVSVGDKPTGLHAVVALGLGKDGTARCVKVKNSWGPGWADDGYAWLREDYFAAHRIALVRMV
jgi:C1A family cysteine protease